MCGGSVGVSRSVSALSSISFWATLIFSCAAASSFLPSSIMCWAFLSCVSASLRMSASCFIKALYRERVVKGTTLRGFDRVTRVSRRFRMLWPYSRDVLYFNRSVCRHDTCLEFLRICSPLLSPFPPGGPPLWPPFSARKVCTGRSTVFEELIGE